MPQNDDWQATMGDEDDLALARCPLCDDGEHFEGPLDVANDDSQPHQQQRRRRRHMRNGRAKNKMQRWWKKYGYQGVTCREASLERAPLGFAWPQHSHVRDRFAGPAYCQRCSEIFRDHIIRQISNSVSPFAVSSFTRYATLYDFPCAAHRRGRACDDRPTAVAMHHAATALPFCGTFAFHARTCTSSSTASAASAA